MQKRSCDIIIPVWNAPIETAECLNSIIKYTRHPYRLIIIDNGSDDRTSEYLRRFRSSAAEIGLIRNEENLGFVRAVNQGMRASSAPYLCLMNNDTVATEGWLEEMIAVAESRPEIGIVNPSSNTFGQEDAEGSKALAGQTQELYSARGFCMLIKREVIEKIGLFDEAFNIGYFEETDFCYRAQAALFRVVRAKGSYVYHKENVTFKELGNNASIFAGNEKIFLGRWGRQARIGYLVEGANAADRVEEIAVSMALKGHQVFIFLKKGLRWPVKLDHINIRRVDASPVFFGLCALAAIIKRKKKKKLDIVVTDNSFLGSVLLNLKRLHGSEVMVSPDAETLSRTAERISKAH